MCTPKELTGLSKQIPGSWEVDTFSQDQAHTAEREVSDEKQLEAERE